MKKKIIKKIEAIQNRPEKEKTKIIWFLSVFCMILVVGLWLFGFSNNRKKTNNSLSQIVLPPFPNIETELQKINQTIGDIDSLKTAVQNKDTQAQIEEISKNYIIEKLSEESYNNLQLKKQERQDNFWYLEYQQYYKNILVEKNIVSLKINLENAEITNFSSTYSEKIDMNIVPDIEVRNAKNLIIAKFPLAKFESLDSSLVIYKNENENLEEYYLTWKIKTADGNIYYVDAQNENLLFYTNLEK